MRLLETFIVGLASAIAIVYAVYVYQLGADSKRSLWINSVYEKKTEDLASVVEPRLVVLAGSSALVGVSAEQLNGMWGLNAYNYATHAGLGIKYLVDGARRVLKKGDTVLMPLETRHYGPVEINDTLVDYVTAYDTEFLSDQHWKTQFEYFSKTPVSRIFHGAYNKITNRPYRLTRYGSHRLNAFGDQVDTDASGITPQARALVARSRPISFPKTVNDDAKTVLTNFIQWAKANDICLIAAPASGLYFEQYRQGSAVTFFKSVAEFYRSNKVSYIGDPYDYLFSLDYMYDTAKHLSAEGTRVRTDRLIRDLGEDRKTHCE